MSKRFFKILSILLLSLVVLFVSGCDRDELEPDIVYTIELSQNEATLDVGQSVTLTATVYADGQKTDANVAWETSSATIASVDQGVVKALTEGFVTITASYEDVFAECKITVNMVEAFLLLDRSTASLKVGESLTLVAEMTDGSNPEITWISSDEDVVTVVNGNITAIGSGEATITARAGEYFAECTVNVSDVVEFIFPEMNESYYVDDVVDLGIVIKKNGVIVEEEFSVTGTGFTYNNGQITIVSSGEIQIIASYNGQEIIRSFVSYQKVETLEDLENINNNLDGYYMLMNDIDVQGTVNTIAHYDDGHESRETGFKGIFDGNGYSIMNFSAVYTNPNASNCSLFGVVGSSGIIRNLNVINVTIDKRIAGGVATINYGTIENCYVDAYFTVHRTTDENNPMGGITAKNYGTIANCISVVKVKEGVSTVNIGAITGRSYPTAQVIDSFAIAKIGAFESANPTNIPTTPNGGTASNVETYATIEEFYANANRTSFGSLWTFKEGYYPTLREVPTTVELLTNDEEIYSGTKLQLQFTSEFDSVITLKEAIPGVTLTADGLLSLTDEVLTDTIITIVLRSLYNEQAMIEHQIRVLANEYKAISEKEIFTFEAIAGVSPAEDFQQAHGIVITYNDQQYDGDVQFRSSDENIAIANRENIIAINDGLVTIDVIVDGIVLYTFTVNSNVYQPVYTLQDLEAIATDDLTLAKKYILMNDIDVNGPITTIAHYAAGYSSSTKGFSGIFDGNGFTIKNFYAVFGAQTGNCSLFGTVAEAGIIRNLNVIDVTIDKRIAGGIATINYGTIENCYVDVYVTYNTSTDQNNPMGGIASKNYGTITNCISVVKIKEGISTVNIGGIAGRAYAGGSINNSFTISVLDIFETAVPTNDGNVINGGTLTNVAAYQTLEAFYAEADRSSFGSEWRFIEGYYPSIGIITENIGFTENDENAYVGTSIQINFNSGLNYLLYLKEAIPGVSLSVDGVLTLSNDAPINSIITIVLESLYNQELVYELQLTVLENTYEVSDVQEVYDFKYIIGVSDESQLTTDIVITVMKAGTVWTGMLTGISANEQVAVIENGKIVVRGDGSTTIGIYIDDIILATITINCEMYYPIYTTTEFLAIGTDKATMAKKYILMNDLDFNNQKIEAFSSYKTNGATGLNFSGVFDGNGYTIANFEPFYNTKDASDRDISIFGYLVSKAVVRNVNFIGVIGNDRVSVVSNWNEGTIEDVYVEMNYVFTAELGNKNNNNPGGVVVAKNRGTGKVNNCVVVLSFVEGANTTYLGGVVGNNSGSVTNCQLITTDGTVNVVYNGAGALTNSNKYANLEEFYLSDLSNYNDNWTLAPGYYPHIGEVTKVINVNNEPLEVYAGNNLLLDVSPTYGLRFSLKEPVEGVSLNGKTLLVDGSVAGGTKVWVVIESIYRDLKLEIEITVLENSYEAIDVQENYEFELTKDVSDEALFTQDLVLTVLNNGHAWDGVLTGVSANSDVAILENGKVIAVGDGFTTIALYADGIQVTTVTVKVALYHPIYTLQDLEAIATDDLTLAKKYLLMNDIDANGPITTIAHYAAGYSSSTKGFSGIFDGNGFTIKNFYAVFGTQTGNCSLFGTVAEAGIIRNLNVIDVTIDKRIAGGIATINYGTIENCYVDAYFTINRTTDQNNPMGGIASKNYGTITNCISVVKIKEGISTVNIGGIAGRAYAGGSINNSFTISVLDIFETAVPTNDGNVINGGTLTNVAAYQTLEAFYAEADRSTFGSEWRFIEGYYPSIGKITENIGFTENDENAYVGTSIQINFNSGLNYLLYLKEAIPGVSLSVDGVLTLSNNAPINSIITIVLESLYNQELVYELQLTVLENTYEVSDVQEVYDFEFIKDVTDETKTTADIVMTVIKSGNIWTGTLTGISADELVAGVENGKIVARGDGATTIDIYADGVILTTITVNSVMYHPIYTTTEFLAIGTDKVTMAKKYILMNDLDFNNQQVSAFSSYKTNAASGLNFSGVFDGNGYTIANFEPFYNTKDTSDRDISIFGYLVSKAIVRNVNFIGVIGNDRVSVVSNWNEGTVEDVYVEMNYVFTAASGNKSSSNPGGVVVAKNRGTGKVNNCVVVLSFVEGANTTYLGGVVGNNSGSVTNCQLITTDGTVNVVYNGAGALTNSNKYANLEEFYLSDLSNYNDNWTFTPGYFPHVGEVPVVIVVNNETLDVYAGNSLLLDVSPTYGLRFSLKEPVEGVSINGNTVVVDAIASSTKVSVVIESLYRDLKLEIEINILVLPEE